MPRLFLLLGDQLTPGLLRGADPSRDVVLLAEVREEATYVPHHPKKIAFCFSAMRHFAAELRGLGWSVRYIRFDDPANSGSLSGEVVRAVADLDASGIVVTRPGEWRLWQEFHSWSVKLALPVAIREDPRFLTTPEVFGQWAEGRKQMRMEYFYRDMRRKTGLLMEGYTPVGGRWNFDSDNRQAARPSLFMPHPLQSQPDAITEEVLTLVAAQFSHNFGALTPFWFATTRAGAEAAFDHFVDTALPEFGTYQDAMLRDEKFLWHSVISMYLNAGLLEPLTVCRRAERAFHEGHAPLNSVEGFIRQIIGWREYVRGIYWLKMPGYVHKNHLGHHRPLPSFYWSGETDMACLRAAITQTRDEAYAHHIQRLMVTGNFALLAGVDPKAVHEWYLAVYADAYEWVELPNTLGMSQFADGGLLGSKPYVSGGNYINKMSDYCGACRYRVTRKTEDDACPFNALYWDFLVRHRSRLSTNPRLGPVYRTWDRMAPETQTLYRARAADLLSRLDTL